MSIDGMPLNGDFIQKVILQGGVLSGIGGAIYWALQKRLENRFAVELERTKNQLQLEHAKLSIVYEHQKDSFRKVLAAMHRAMEAIEDKIEAADGPWEPISSEDRDRFHRAISRELLFLDGRTEFALDTFEKIMWDAIEDFRFDSHPDSDDVSQAYEDLKLISSRVAEHFRITVGLAATSSTDPLIDVEILAACKLVSSWRTPEKKAEYARRQRRAEQLVIETKRNPDELLAGLTEIQQDISSDPEKTRRLFRVLSQAERLSSRIRDMNGTN